MDDILADEVGRAEFGADVNEFVIPAELLDIPLMHKDPRLAELLERRAAELLKLMPYKAPPDTSKFLLSPMPGLLVHIAVQPGQLVQAGERLAVIEAMKMENILSEIGRAHV